LAAPLVSTKLRAPATGAGHRERQRVSALLDRGLEDSTRLILLSAPSGYRKTVAAVDWLGSPGIGYAWLSLDAADNDLARFTRIYPKKWPVRGIRAPDHLIRSPFPVESGAAGRFVRGTAPLAAPIFSIPG
jgi:hypothetical protein